MNIGRARTLRRVMTEAERRMWSVLRNRQVAARKFRRQEPIGPYVVDFVCESARLIVELDGGQHADQQRADAARTAWLEAEGYRVLRFWNNEIFENLPGVAERVRLELLGEWRC